MLVFFFKSNINNICIDRFFDRQKLSNNLKRKAADDMFTRPSKIIRS